MAIRFPCRKAVRPVGPSEAHRLYPAGQIYILDLEMIAASRIGTSMRRPCSGPGASPHLILV